MLSFPFWMDEMGMVLAVLTGIPFSADAPLSALVTRPLISVTNPQLMTFRYISVLWGTLTIGVIGFFFRCLFNRGTGVFAAILCAGYPFLVLHSTQVRPYALYQLIFAVFLLIAWWANRQRSILSVFLLLMAAALAVSTHLSFLPFLMGLGATLLWIRRKELLGLRRSISGVNLSLGSVFAALLILTPLTYPAVRSTLRKNLAKWISLEMKSPLELVLTALPNFDLGNGFAGGDLGRNLLLIFWSAVLVGFYFLFKRRKSLAIACVTTSALSLIVIYIVAPAGSIWYAADRYCFHIAFALMTCLGALFDEVYRRSLFLGAGSMGVLLVGLLLASTQYFPTSDPSSEVARNALRSIREDPRFTAFYGVLYENIGLLAVGLEEDYSDIPRLYANVKGETFQVPLEAVQDRPEYNQLFRPLSADEPYLRVIQVCPRYRHLCYLDANVSSELLQWAEAISAPHCKVRFCLVEPESINYEPAKSLSRRARWSRQEQGQNSKYFPAENS